MDRPYKKAAAYMALDLFRGTEARPHLRWRVWDEFKGITGWWRNPRFEELHRAYEVGRDYYTYGERLP